MSISPSEIATVLLVLAIVVERLIDRRDRRREAALKDAQAAGELKDDYVGELEKRVARLEREKVRDRQTIEAMRQALKWFFDEVASSDRCKRAAAGCPNRIAPGGELPDERMAQIRELLEHRHEDEEAEI